MPGIDITDAVRDAELQCNGVIAACNHSYMATSSNTADKLSVPEGLFLDRESRQVTEKQLDYSCSIVGKALDLSNLVYRDDRCALNYYCINNPYRAGANGIQLEYENKRFFIVSGMLTGCGFAVLVKKQYLYIIHAGAGTATADDAARRRGYINWDICCMARRLSDSNFYTGPDKRSIPCDALYTYLRMNEFFGFLILPGDQTAISPEEGIWTLQYGLGENSMADVICALNERGEMMISRRILEYDSRGNTRVNDAQGQVALFL